MLVYAASGLHVGRRGRGGRGAAFRQDRTAGRAAGAPLPAALSVRHATASSGPTRSAAWRSVFAPCPASFDEPPAYEWNVQHRGGRSEPQAEEATVWTGDENLADVNLVVQYRVADPVAALFEGRPARADGASKWDALVRAVAEAGVAGGDVAAGRVEAVLSAERSEIEEAVRDRMAAALTRVRDGLHRRARLPGRRPPAAGGRARLPRSGRRPEEKEATINEAEAYQFETEADGPRRGRREAARRRGGRPGSDRDGPADAPTASSPWPRPTPQRPDVTRCGSTWRRSKSARRPAEGDPRPRRPPARRRQLFLGRQGLWGDCP